MNEEWLEPVRIPLFLMACLAVLTLLVLLWQRHTPLHQLIRAIRRGDIVPWYQPVINARTGKLVGCEVLARWVPDGELPRPAMTFIPLAERSGWIVPLTRHLMRQVEKDLLPVLSLLPPEFHLSVNISAAHVEAPGFVADCLRLQNALAARQVVVVVEVTEREKPASFPAMRALLDSLRAAGVRVALDDFGTEFASLVSLDALPVNYIKLDKRFTDRIRDGEGLDGLDAPCLVADIVTDIASRMNIEVVAEGVETGYQKTWLAGKGVRWQQGYYFSPPLPVKAFIRWLVGRQGAGQEV
jgi:sensor c-di-GMP phosphodiesterase-like protein